MGKDNEISTATPTEVREIGRVTPSHHRKKRMGLKSKRNIDSNRVRAVVTDLDSVIEEMDETTKVIIRSVGRSRGF